MISLAHLLLGALIGKTMSNLLFIAVLAFVTHFALDAIPHIDQGSFKRREQFKARDWWLVAIDFGIGAGLVIYFALTNDFWPIIFGAFFAVLPDFISGGSWLFRIKRWPVIKQINQFHSLVGFRMKREFVVLGVIFEVLIILAVFSLLLF